MNFQAVALALVAMVAMASGFGYNSYNTGLLGSGRLGGSWGLGGSRWGNSWNGGRLSRGGRRYRRAAIGYGSYNGHFGSGFLGNRWGSRLGGGLEWRRSSGLGSWGRGY